MATFEEVLKDLLASPEGGGPFGTVSEFAQRTGVQASQISRIKKGRDFLADGVRDKIVDYYRKSNEEFAERLRSRLIEVQINPMDGKVESTFSQKLRESGVDTREAVSSEFGQREMKAGAIVEIFKADPSTSMQVVAERFMRDRRMPFYGIYLPLRGAGRWVFYSEQGEAASEKKRNYEGDQCEELLGDWFVKYEGRDLSIISLGVGEGIGEIEIIERLLKRKQFRRIHYCAIDTNIYLLMDHATRLRNRFKKEVAEKTLICSVVRGNFLTHFSELIAFAREEVRRQFRDPDIEFLPEDSGKLISVLGNVIGNLEHRASEWTYFQPILEEFKSRDVAFLLGIGIRQKGKKEAEEYPLDDLFLSTLRYLTYELKLLKSVTDNGDTREFYADGAGNFESVTSKYQGDGFVSGAHVSGDIYEFIYTTIGHLSMNLETGDELTIPSGTKVLLYNIIKFDLDNFITFLESKGLFLKKDFKTLSLGQEKEKRIYAVLAATTTDPLP